MLKQAGWSDDRIRDAVDTYADVEFSVPVPKARHTVQARDAFQHLVLFSTLALCAWFFGNLLFQLVNIYVPNPLQSIYPGIGPERFERQIRTAVSVLVVAFPLYIFMAVWISRELERDPTRLQSGVRKWLTWLALFVATLVILADVVLLIQQFLNGTLTTHFVLKILIVGLISSVIFVYYLRSISRGNVSD